MPTRIGYSRDIGLWVIKDAEGKITHKVGGFKIFAQTDDPETGPVLLLESSIEPTPDASKANYGDYNAMMDIPDGINLEIIDEKHTVEWKNGVCPVCNHFPTNLYDCAISDPEEIKADSDA